MRAIAIAACVGICLGFNLMKEAESVDYLFEILRTRFPVGTTC